MRYRIGQQFSNNKGHEVRIIDINTDRLFPYTIIVVNKRKGNGKETYIDRCNENYFMVFDLALVSTTTYRII